MGIGTGIRINMYFKIQKYTDIYAYVYVCVSIFKSTWGSSLYLNNTWKHFSIKPASDCMLNTVYRKEQWNALPYYVWARCLLSNPESQFLPKPAGRLEPSAGTDLRKERTSRRGPDSAWHLCVQPHASSPPFPPPSAATQALIFGLLEVVFHRGLMLPHHCWGEQTASQPVKLYFLATCLKLQLPDMANEFYNQKLKWISCSRCFYSGNYQTFLAAHLSFKRIKLCTSIMCCHWSIAQLYQTFYSGNWINFLQGFFCVAL